MSRIPMSEQQPASTTDNAQATSEGGRGRRPGKPERSSRDQSKMLAVGREKIAERRWKEAVNALKRVRSEEHTSELQSLMRISYAVFCLKNKNKNIKSKQT